MEAGIHQQPVYATFLFLSGGVTLLIVLLSYRRRHSAGGQPFVLLMITVTLWNWINALSWITPSNFWVLFLRRLAFLGVVTAPVLLFIFSVEFTNRSSWWSRKYSVLLSIEPLVALILIWTDPSHNLYFGGHFEQAASGYAVGGIWFWIHNTYTFILILVSFTLFIQAGVRQKAVLYRKQTRVCLTGFMVLFLYHFLNLTNRDPLSDINALPIIYTITGLFFGYSILGFQMLDINPVPLDILIDQMKDGLMVLDTHSRIIEINQVAASLAGGDAAHLIGTDLESFLHKVPGFSFESNQNNPSCQEIMLKGPPPRVMELNVNPIKDRKESWLGDLLVWHDITYLKNIEHELQQANELIREQAIHDPLTGLHNRRYLNEILPKEIARAERLEIHLAFLIIDIDHFKSVNDTYGHETGDVVLLSLATYLEKTVRRGDIVIRYGGEEFLLILIDSNEENAYQRAEEIRQGIKKMSISFGQTDISITVSIGLAIFPVHGFEAIDVIRTADQALYRAKNSGRDRVYRAE